MPPLKAQSPNYAYQRVYAYDVLAPYRRTELKFDPQRAATYSLLATVALSGAATAYANISHEPIPFPHPTIDTRHEVNVDTKASNDPTLTTLKDGSHLYTPPQPDRPKTDDLYLSKSQLEEVTTSAAFGAEIAADDASLTRSMDAALQVLRSNDVADQTALSITRVIEQSNTVTLSDSEASDLKAIATRHHMNSSQLIEAYKSGRLGQSAADVTKIESLLVTNQNDTYSIDLTKDGQKLDATLYKVDTEYTLVVERPLKKEPQGGEYPIVIIPVPIPWFRRRTVYDYPELRTTTLPLSYDPGTGGYYDARTRPDSFLYDTASKRQDTIINQDTVTIEDRWQGPLLKNGGRYYGGSPGGGVSDLAPASPERVDEPVPLTPEAAEEAEIFTRPKLDLVDPIIEEETPAPEVQVASEPEPAPKEVETAEKEPRKRLKIPLWLILGAAGTAISIPIAAGIATVQPPSPQPTGSTTEPGASTQQGTTNPGTTAPQPLTPEQYIYEHVHDVTIAGQSLTTLNGKLDELQTIGTPDNVHIYDRLSATLQPVPPAPKPVLPIVIQPGEGGEQLMKSLGKNPSEWYKIAPQLRKDHPTDFYQAGDGIRLSHSGPLQSEIVSEIDNLTK